ncbi:MAG: hypothetical protein ACOX4N_00040 [Dethiobacteraceae bacterium]|jgi:hypothetical protein
MKATDKFIPLLEGAIEQIKKDGYCLIELSDHSHIFCNQNFAEVKLGIRGGFSIRMTFLSAE